MPLKIKFKNYQLLACQFNQTLKPTNSRRCSEAVSSLASGPWADSLPWFDPPLVQGASRLRYTDKAQVQRPGHTGRKALATKKNIKANKHLFEHTGSAARPSDCPTRPARPAQQIGNLGPQNGGQKPRHQTRPLSLAFLVLHVFLVCCCSFLLMRPMAVVGAEQSLAAPDLVQFCEYTVSFPLVTRLKASGTSRKKLSRQETPNSVLQGVYVPLNQILTHNLSTLVQDPLLDLLVRHLWKISIQHL